MPHRGWAGGSPLGATGGEARAAEWVRREVQPAVSPRRDPRQGAGGPRGVRGRGRARRRSARRRRPGELRAGSDHRLSTAVRRSRPDPVERWAAARGAAGPPAGRRRVSDAARRAGGEVPRQRRPRHIGRAGVAGDPARERARHSGQPSRALGSSDTVRGRIMKKRSAVLSVLALTWALTAVPASAQDARVDAARKEGKVVWYTSLAL